MSKKGESEWVGQEPELTCDPAAISESLNNNSYPLIFIEFPI